MSEQLAEQRLAITTGCRILAARGLAPGFLGHISLRIDKESLLIRGRRPQERGLLYSVPADVDTVQMNGETAEGIWADAWTPPNELPIHSQILAARPDVDCVVHCHPRATVVADLAGLELLPSVGAFDIPGAKLAADGLPVYQRSVLVNDTDLGDELADALGGGTGVVMRGHGLTTVGASVEEAVLRALSINEIFQIMMDVHASGGKPRPIPDEDLAQLPDLGPGFNTGVAWRHEVARLAHVPGLDSLAQEQPHKSPHGSRPEAPK